MQFINLLFLISTCIMLNGLTFIYVLGFRSDFMPIKKPRQLVTMIKALFVKLL